MDAGLQPTLFSNVVSGALHNIPLPLVGHGQLDGVVVHRGE